MKKIIIFNIALCSIVAMLTISCSKDYVQENQFETVEFSTRSGEVKRWQQQLEWTAGAYKSVFPELRLLGWRKIGTLNCDEAIEKFVEDGLQDNKMFGHTVDLEKEIYEIATRSELTQKYGVWDDNAIEIIKQQFIDAIPINAEIIELQWNYKGETFTEKIAVINGEDELGSGIVFNTINQFLLVKDVPLAEWQIKDREERAHKAMTITPEEQKFIEEYMRQKRQKNNSTRIGIDGEEEPKTLVTVPTPHYYTSAITIGGISVCCVGLKSATEFDLNTATLNAWDVVIEYHNSAIGYCCSTNAVLTSGIIGQTVSASHIWGWAWGPIVSTESPARVTQGRKELIFTGLCSETFQSSEFTEFCPMY